MQHKEIMIVQINVWAEQLWKVKVKQELLTFFEKVCGLHFMYVGLNMERHYDAVVSTVWSGTFQCGQWSSSVIVRAFTEILQLKWFGLWYYHKLKKLGANK